MSKRTVFTTITPLPAGVTRTHVLDTLHNHVEMIDLNPLVEERHPIKPPPKATPEEFHCVWYEVTDRVQYLPGGIYSGRISYPACFHDLANGIQTHIYAPMGLEIRGKWTLGGSLPGEPQQPVEMGLNVPMVGLYVREDVDMRCNILMTSFVKKTLKKAHSELVARLSVKAQLAEVAMNNDRISSYRSQSSPPLGYTGSIHSSVGSPRFPPQNEMTYPGPSAMHSQSGFSPAQMQMHGYQQQFDPRMSLQLPMASPGQTQDPAFQNAYAQGMYQQQQFQRTELPNNQGSSSADRDTKKVDGAPPVHIAPIELPAHVPK